MSFPFVICVVACGYKSCYRWSACFVMVSHSFHISWSINKWCHFVYSVTKITWPRKIWFFFSSVQIINMYRNCLVKSLKPAMLWDAAISFYLHFHLLTFMSECSKKRRKKRIKPKSLAILCEKCCVNYDNT